MKTTSSSQCVFIIFQELHREPLERNVNDVNFVTIESKVFVRRPLTTINDSFLVLRDRAPLSLKTTFSPQIISMHIVKIHL